MDIHTQFKSFQENQTKQFFEFQKNQFQEFLALFPDRALSKSNVIAVKPVTVKVIKPKKKVKRSANAYAFFTKKIERLSRRKIQMQLLVNLPV